MNRLEVKATLGVDGEGLITGIAWPFGSADRVGDMITKGAFASAKPPIPLLFGHDPLQPVGVWDSAIETDAGLEVKGRLLVNDVPRAREVLALVREGAIGGLSIGFSTKKAAPRKGGGRTISALDLVEISLVAVACHPGAKVTGVKNASLHAIQLAEAINRTAMRLRNPEGI